MCIYISIYGLKFSLLARILIEKFILNVSKINCPQSGHQMAVWLYQLTTLLRKW